MSPKQSFTDLTISSKVLLFCFLAKLIENLQEDSRIMLNILGRKNLVDDFCFPFLNKSCQTSWSEIRNYGGILFRQIVALTEELISKNWNKTTIRLPKCYLIIPSRIMMSLSSVIKRDSGRQLYSKEAYTTTSCWLIVCFCFFFVLFVFSFFWDLNNRSIVECQILNIYS